MMGVTQKSRGNGVTPIVELKMRNTMWRTNYHTTDLIDLFDDEQAYIDAAFILIIYMNFGILLRHDMLNRS
jgi:hypothetical protein